MVRLFEDDATAEAIARDIVGEADESAGASDSDDTLVEEAPEVAEIARAVAAQVKRLSRSDEPVPTDVPLMLAGLNSITVVQLHFWLQSTYDYEEDMSRLFEEDVSAEVVARDIVGDAPSSESEDSDSVEARSESGDSPAPTRRTRLMPKAPLSVKVYPTPEEVPLPEAPMPSSTAKYLTAEAVLDSSMPAAESLSGKKAGLVYGLLALGLLGSPHSPTFHLAQAQQALSPRAPASAHTPVFSPWLDTVRYPAMEAIQSPWVADAPHRSIDSVLFPQSPRVF
ncbi:hypothetical protein OBBRIDRAFT_740556 [Obba rivulosa]|uniref:Uncharacterized protein n=1 Tax=Obba rivulosa TaxID=1052685 RepID=A0A8E2AIY7_9APHY|nr:hypothetical protein OBBRIDRAFT_740556 [Obba rivulosa]